MTVPGSVVRDALRVALAALVLGGIAGLAVAVSASASLRAWFGLTPERPASISAWELWVHNARVLLLAFGAAGAVATWRSRWVRLGFDALVCVWLGGNVLLVAVAFGAYGEPLLMLAPAHYALELLALAVAAAAYLDARREGAVRMRVLGWCAAVAAVLLAAAAVSEGTV